jgi:hypothetical protein
MCNHDRDNFRTCLEFEAEREKQLRREREEIDRVLEDRLPSGSAFVFLLVGCALIVAVAGCCAMIVDVAVQVWRLLE